MPVTLRDIAKHLNLSHATVSFVLNERHDVAIPESTRQRVFEAARELGYRPNRAARALVMGRTQMLGLWMPSLRNSFYGSVFRDLYRYGHEAGYDLIYCEARSDDSGTTPLDWPVDGVIAVDAAWLLKEAVIPPHLPLVTVGSSVDDRHDSVFVDLGVAAEQAVQYLIEAGCRRIVHVANLRDMDDPNGKTAAYMRVMRDAGLEPQIIGAHSAILPDVRTCVRSHVVENGAPDGLFGHNDAMTMASIRGLADAGVQVPTHCRAIGIDGLYESEYSVPSLTTMALPTEEMAAYAIDILRKRIENPAVPLNQVCLKTRLIERESSLMLKS
jgi:DNA-binding LacI/PurR family transcriptional regulator